MEDTTFRALRLICARCRQPFVWTAEAQAAQAARDARMDAPRSCFTCRGKRRARMSGREGVTRYAPR